MAKGIQPSRTTEAAYRRDLDAMIAKMVEATLADLVPLLTGFESEYVADISFTGLIGETIRALKRTFQGLFGVAAEPTAETMVNSEFENNAEKFQRDVLRTDTDISLGRIIGQEKMQPTLEAAVAENVSLITSIPDQYYKDLSGIVMRNITAGETADSIVDQIQALTGTTRNRAKLIARDQTAKTNAAINQTRQESLGVTEYVWQTAEDNRVRPTHAAHNGKIFRWDDPPKDTGHPGNDVNCRCVARAIIPTDILT